jgi:uncharacterized protein (DUF2336 family)
MARAKGYEREKHAARHGAATERARLAGRTDVPPELLYFLAQDADTAVRRAVAANPATPAQANTLLARDADYGVRCALAQKAVGAGLSDQQRRDLWRMGFTLLETLAVDQLVRVRKILSQVLAREPEAPRPVILTLARDAEPEVAEPVLENSPVLTEDDLVELVEGGAPAWAQAAIAGRAQVSARLAEAIVAKAQPAAVERLGRSKGTQETPEARAARLAREGKLNDEVVSLALSAGERGFVTAALALRAGVDLHAARRIAASKSAKAVTALAWKAKFPMRFAVEVQARLAGIGPGSLLYARDGIDYPLTPTEMNWHLGLFAD